MRLKTQALSSVALLTLAMGCGAPDEPLSQTESYFWNAGTLSSNSPSVCWVNAAASTNPNDVSAIQDVLRQWQWRSGLRFKFTGNCGNPTVGRDGKENFPGEVRILLQLGDWPAPKEIPGKGCIDPKTGKQAMDDGPLWSSPPNDRAYHCQYNMHLTLNQARNNYLHESGHAIGLQHEHERPDATCLPTGGGPHYGGTYITGYYDILSVMHYVAKQPNCEAPGNWGDTGLTDGDHLAAEGMYPEHSLAKIFGATVLRQGQVLKLQTDWGARGVNINTGDPSKSIMKSFSWTLAGTSYTTPTLNVVPPVGDHVLTVGYQDYWGHSYSSGFRVRVLTPSDYKRKVLAAVL